MRYRLVLLLLLCVMAPAGAETAATETKLRTVAGVQIPVQIRTHSDATPLQLNGAGMRRKFLFDIYVGALYLPQPAHDMTSISNQPGPKRVAMHFVMPKVDAEKLVNAWNDGFSKNLSSEELRNLRPRIANFNGLFPAVHKGDRVDIDYIPGLGTQVWINDSLRGKVAGEDFFRALLRIWLGEHPADARLKKAMLAAPR